MGSNFSRARSPVRTAFDERDRHGADLLIIGAGKTCEAINSAGHTPHPPGCLTASLPDGPGVGIFVDPDIVADVTNSAHFTRIVRAVRPEPFQVVHFENIDNDVARSAGAIASADALLAGGGTLIIECGPLGSIKGDSLEQRALLALNEIMALLAVLGYSIHHSDTNITVIAKKREH